MSVDQVDFLERLSRFSSCHFPQPFTLFATRLYVFSKRFLSFIFQNFFVSVTADSDGIYGTYRMVNATVRFNSVIVYLLLKNSLILKNIDFNFVLILITFNFWHLSYKFRFFIQKNARLNNMFSMK